MQVYAPRCWQLCCSRCVSGMGMEPDPLLAVLDTPGWVSCSVELGKRRALKHSARSCSFTTFCLLSRCHCHSMVFFPLCFGTAPSPIPLGIKLRNASFKIVHHPTAYLLGCLGQFLIESHPLGRPGLERVNYSLPGSLCCHHEGTEARMVGTEIWFYFLFPCQAPDLVQGRSTRIPIPGHGCCREQIWAGGRDPSPFPCVGACACTLRSASFWVCTAH